MGGSEVRLSSRAMSGRDLYEGKKKLKISVGVSRIGEGWSGIRYERATKFDSRECFDRANFAIEGRHCHSSVRCGDTLGFS